jgi:hypothetical protein
MRLALKRVACAERPMTDARSRERSAADQAAASGPAEERKLWPDRSGPRAAWAVRAPGRRPLEPQIGSFGLHLAAEGKAARTVQGYASAMRWFAAG